VAAHGTDKNATHGEWSEYFWSIGRQKCMATVMTVTAVIKCDIQ
jgi:hypothetical protein